MQENIHNTSFEPLSPRENFLAKKVVDIAFKIHAALGPGLLKSVYEKCFCYELENNNIPYIHQQLIAVKYEDIFIENA